MAAGNVCPRKHYHSVIDFLCGRKHGNCNGCARRTWTALLHPAAVCLHGVALIRARTDIPLRGTARRDVGVYASGGPNQYALSENSPRITSPRPFKLLISQYRLLTVRVEHRPACSHSSLLTLNTHDFLSLGGGHG